MLTGKCKEDFELWFVTSETGDKLLKLLGTKLKAFGYLPFEMQSGVYLAFFDIVGIYINTQERSAYFAWRIKDDGGLMKTRPEALKKAITQAGLIYNENN